MFRLFSSKPNAAPAAQIDPLLAFVREIGLEVREAPLRQPTFLPGLLLERGALVLDRTRLLYPGDILHEAGHLAVTPAAERPTVGGNITQNHPEKEGEELAVLAWSYAAARALALPPAVVFHPDGYKGQSEWLISSFEGGQYIGLPLLVWMGLTTTAGFPRMERWLRA
ncbi:hypothetical protein [Hymenobacter psychrotolerans]|uniref:Uncharacterized protein n=1 Tax=Hymenobacter psychrotolerans DSM 18569 TaxID=1121959 RepID=A0A1M6XYN3_9BACT|nr:hypothetical protein [Hymenobacter psychrotolerans]SHL11097.1 hypothetical protein SAMN02746009_02132 [Hymenobacter psychrotolerans DSM 18569]